MAMTTTISLPRALLLDMDGTITEPMLDFPRIKAEMGIGQRPILEALAELSGPRAGCRRGGAAPARGRGCGVLDAQQRLPRTVRVARRASRPCGAHHTQ
jgi:hypothetical protein